MLGGVCASGRDRLLEAHAYASPTDENRCRVSSRYFTSAQLGVVDRYVKGRGANQGSLDLLPGGSFGVFEEVAKGSRDGFWLYKIEAIAPFIAPDFIPSVSSFALNNRNRNWAEPLTFINSGNVKSLTPFDALYAPEENEEHVTVTAAGVAFLKVQLRESGTIESVMSGRWDNPATWRCGLIPGVADFVRINAGITVTVVNAVFQIRGLTLNGTLSYEPGGRLIINP